MTKRNKMKTCNCVNLKAELENKISEAQHYKGELFFMSLFVVFFLNIGGLNAVKEG